MPHHASWEKVVSTTKEVLWQRNRGPYTSRTRSRPGIEMQELARFLRDVSGTGTIVEGGMGRARPR